MNRYEHRRIAQARLVDAQVLLQARRYAAAYYLAGYVVECALKACIARQFRRADIPEPGTVRDIYVHDLVRLRHLAGLDGAYRAEATRDPQFEVAWLTVRGWKETSRYSVQRARVEADDLYRSVADPTHGVLRWLKQHW